MVEVLLRMCDGKSIKKKPDSVINYNKAKKSEIFQIKKASYFTSLRKTLKWYRKLIIVMTIWIWQKDKHRFVRKMIIRFAEKN